MSIAWKCKNNDRIIFVTFRLRLKVIMSVLEGKNKKTNYTNTAAVGVCFCLPALTFKYKYMLYMLLRQILIYLPQKGMSFLIRYIIWSFLFRKILIKIWPRIKLSVYWMTIFNTNLQFVIFLYIIHLYWLLQTYIRRRPQRKQIILKLL